MGLVGRYPRKVPELTEGARPQARSTAGGGPIPPLPHCRGFLGLASALPPMSHLVASQINESDEITKNERALFWRGTVFNLDEQMRQNPQIISNIYAGSIRRIINLAVEIAASFPSVLSRKSPIRSALCNSTSNNFFISSGPAIIVNFSFACAAQNRGAKEKRFEHPSLIKFGSEPDSER